MVSKVFNKYSMDYRRLIPVILLFCMWNISFAVEVDDTPISVSSYFDLGQVVSGTFDSPGDMEAEFLHRLGAYISKSATINSRLDINLGVGGLFYYSFPPKLGAPWSFLTSFGPGMTEASFAYKWGDIEQPSIKFQAGFFSYKYNPDAMNLGEYLFRSNTYPNVLKTGGWSLMNSAGYGITGIRLGFSHLDGAFNHDFILAMESDTYPMKTISPAWVGSINFGGIFEFGIGASWQHLITTRAEWVTPESGHSTIVTFEDFPEIDPYFLRAEGENGTIDTLFQMPGHRAGTPWTTPELDVLSYDGGPDPYYAVYWDDNTTGGVDNLVLVNVDSTTKRTFGVSTTTVLPVWYDTLSNTNFFKDSTEVLWYTADSQMVAKDDPNAVSPSEERRYSPTEGYVFKREAEKITFRGIKTMGRFSLNLGKLLGLEEQVGVNGFKIFGEAAILGIQNQPYYYEDISKRIPVMMGVHVPTWKILDLLSFQVEYFKTDYKNSLELMRYSLGTNQIQNDPRTFNNLPLPARERAAAKGNLVYGTAKGIYYNDPEKNIDDDWKWSLYFKKCLVPGLNLYGQIASDHMRTFSFENVESFEPVFTDPKEWYYLLRLEYGM